MSLSGGQLSGGNTVTRRASYDFYATNPVAVRKLMDCLDNDEVPYNLTHSLEPCVGTGNIVSEFGLPDYRNQLWTCLDIVDRGYPNTIVQDYLAWKADKKFSFIITNPPFNQAAEFVEKSMELLADKGICCMFLKLQFLEGQKRKQLFKKYPPKYIYVFRNRMATWKNGLEKNPDTGKKWSETICFAWFVWVKDSNAEPIIRWID